jgi:hypothetical protein
MILVGTKTTPNFSYGGGVMSPGEKIECSMSVDGEFNQLVYLLEDTTVLCTPLDPNSGLAPRILNPGLNDLSQYMNIPVELKNAHYGTDLDVGSKWIAIKPRPMTDRYTMSLIENNQTIVGNTKGRYIICFSGEVTVNSNTKIGLLHYATVQNNTSVTVNLSSGALAVLLEKV